MKIKTHIDFVDRLLGGGVRPGEVTLHAGLIGGGKTALAVQIGWECIRHAYRSHRSCRVVYLDSDKNILFLANLVSCSAWIPRSTAQLAWMKGGKSVLSVSGGNSYETIVEAASGVSPESELSRFELAVRLLNNSFELFAGQEVCDLRNLVQGDPVDLIIVDGLSLYTLAATGEFASRKGLEKTLKNLEMVAKSCSCPVWVTHQLNSAQNLLNPTVPDPVATDRLRNIWPLVGNGIVSGALSSTNHAVFIHHTGDPRIVGYLRQDFCRWSLATEKCIRDGQVVRQARGARP